MYKNFESNRGKGIGDGSGYGEKIRAGENKAKQLKTRTGRLEVSAVNSKMLAGGSIEPFEKSAGLIFENQGNRESKPLSDSVRWLTSAEAAQYLRVSISSLKTMIYRGQVRVRKLGNRNRFLREELERLIILPVHE